MASTVRKLAPVSKKRQLLELNKNNATILQTGELCLRNNWTLHCCLAVNTCNISQLCTHLDGYTHFTWTPTALFKGKDALIALTSYSFLSVYKKQLFFKKNTWLCLLCKLNSSLYCDACRQGCMKKKKSSDVGGSHPLHLAAWVCHYDRNQLNRHWQQSLMNMNSHKSALSPSRETTTLLINVARWTERWLFNGTSLTMDFWSLMSGIYFCIILTRDNKINT